MLKPTILYPLSDEHMEASLARTCKILAFVDAARNIPLQLQQNDPLLTYNKRYLRNLKKVCGDVD
jgi:hypothetical protein